MPKPPKPPKAWAEEETAMYLGHTFTHKQLGKEGHKMSIPFL
jgi:hypothetical protein